MSYCHADEAWAAWLHRSLESYRVPTRLVGTKGSHGVVPARLTPIFRDRDDLSSSPDLSTKIRDALADSEALIVICSPAAAASTWVNEEIRLFRSLGRQGRIYCVIVDGEPGMPGSDSPCFPAALLECADHQSVEPLAADVRDHAGGRTLAKLKLISAIIGVRLDALRQRDQQRKKKFQAVAGFVMIAVLALVFFSIQSRMAENEARLAQEVQQASAESMLARFLEESERLVDVADLETRKAFAELMASYLADLDPDDLTLESRRQLGVALMNRGVIFRAEGDLKQAMSVFEKAHQTLQLLVNDAEEDMVALFELSQAEYWIGQVYLDLGQMEEAGKSFEAYALVSETLHNKNPENADWTMEAAYAQSNLGNLEKRKTPSDPHLALQYYKSALEHNEQAARQDEGYERELTDSHADLADAWLGVCDLEQAMAHRSQNVELAARHLEHNTASKRMKADYAHSLSGLSWVQQQAGQIDQARDSLEYSLDLHVELLEEDPSNLGKRWSLLKKSAYLLQLQYLAGNDVSSWDSSLALEADIRQLVDQDQHIRIDNAIFYGVFLRGFADRAYHKGEPELAYRLLRESIRQLEGVAAEHPANRRVFNELAMSRFCYWDQNGTTWPGDLASVPSIEAREASYPVGCSDLNIASRKAVMAGDTGKARTYVTDLIGKGYQEPGFRRFCLKYGLCD